MNLPVALTCGDPNGIGIDISFEAKKELKNRIMYQVLRVSLSKLFPTSLFY